MPWRKRHNDHDGVSNHQAHGCLLNRLFRRRSKKTSKLQVTGFCAGKFTGTCEFPAQMTSYAENVSIWWRHHGPVKSLWVEKYVHIGTDLSKQGMDSLCLSTVSVGNEPQPDNVKDITITSWWARWRLKSPASPLFTQPFVQPHIKQNIKAPRHWPLCGNSPVTGEFPAQMASNAENVSIWWRHHIYCIYTNNM